MYNSSLQTDLQTPFFGVISVTESKLTLLAAQQANKSGDEVLRQGIATLFGKPVDHEDGS